MIIVTHRDPLAAPLGTEQARPMMLPAVVSSVGSHIRLPRPKETSMSTTTSSNLVLVDDPVQTEAVAIAGFLAGYCGARFVTRRSALLACRADGDVPGLLARFLLW